MDTTRRTTIIVGLLFIAATTAYSISDVMLGPILRGEDFLGLAAADPGAMTWGALLVLIDSVAVAGIGTLLYPILRRQHVGLAMGFTGARLIESALFMVNVIAILTLLSVSQELAQTGTLDAGPSAALGSAILAFAHWSYLLGLGLAFALSALILNAMLFHGGIVPRWISGLGLIGAVLLLADFFIELFGNPPIQILFLPIAVQEMIFALWLIVKGSRLRPDTLAQERQQ